MKLSPRKADYYQERYLFLFNDVLVYARPKKNLKFQKGTRPRVHLLIGHNLSEHTHTHTMHTPTTHTTRTTRIQMYIRQTVRVPRSYSAVDLPRARPRRQSGRRRYFVPFL
jgi:hypothetical protein